MAPTPGVSGRPRRPPLTRDRVVRAALEVIDADGLAALSMRRLGRELGVTAMSLYHHFATKDDILYAVVDRVLSEVDGVAAEDPVSAARAMAHRMRDALRRHPNVLPIVATKGGGATAEGLAATYEAVRLAVSAGFSPREAAYAHVTVTSWVTGFVFAEAAEAGVDLAAEERQRAALRQRRSGVPEVDSVLDGLRTEDFDFDAAFEYGLNAVLSGLLSNLRP